MPERKNKLVLRRMGIISLYGDNPCQISLLETDSGEILGYERSYGEGTETERMLPDDEIETLVKDHADQIDWYEFKEG